MIMALSFRVRKDLFKISINPVLVEGGSLVPESPLAFANSLLNDSTWAEPGAFSRTSLQWQPTLTVASLLTLDK